MTERIHLIVRNAFKYEDNIVYICDVLSGMKKKRKLHLIIENLNTLLPVHTQIPNLSLEIMRKYRVDGGKLFLLTAGHELYTVDSRDIQYMLITSKSYYYKTLAESGILDEVVTSLVKNVTIGKDDLLLIAFLMQEERDDFIQRVKKKYEEIRKRKVNTDYILWKIYEKASIQLHNIIISQTDIESEGYMDYEDVKRILDISYENAISFVKMNYVYHDLLERFIREMQDFYRNRSEKYEQKYLKGQPFWIHLRKLIMQNSGMGRKATIYSLEELRDVVMKAMSSERKRILINGPAGTGKTRTLYDIYTSREDTIFLTTLKAVKDQFNNLNRKRVYTVAEVVRNKKLWKMIVSHEIKNIIIDEFSFFSIYDIPVLNYILSSSKNLIVVGDTMQARNPSHFSLFSLFCYLDNRMNIFDVYDLKSEIRRTDRISVRIISSPEHELLQKVDIILVDSHIKRISLQNTLGKQNIMTVHQAQGTEHDTVYVILDYVDTRTVYTAVTRAKNTCIIQTPHIRKIIEILKDLYKMNRLPKIDIRVGDYQCKHETENNEVIELFRSQTDNQNNTTSDVIPVEISQEPQEQENADSERNTLPQTTSQDILQETQISHMTDTVPEEDDTMLTHNLVDLINSVFENVNETKRKGRKPSTSLKILEILRQHQGLTFGEIKQKSELSKYTLSKLLNILKKKNVVLYRDKRYFINEMTDMKKEDKDRVIAIITEEVYLMLQRINDRIRREDLGNQETIDEKLQKKYIRQDELSLLHWKQ